MAKQDKEYRYENAAEVAKAKRQAIHAAKEATEKTEDSKEEFRKFFAQEKSKLNLSPSLESVIWLHLKAYGFDKKEKFSSGLKHFGIGE
jgi:hypothetical protein